MTTAASALGEQSQIAATLDAGVEQLSVRQNVPFQQYTRVALSPDGSVFWVATSAFTTVTGALHIATDRLQDEDQTIAANQVLLTAEAPITEFNDVAPGTMWIGAWPITAQRSLQIAFAQTGNFFGPAKLWHYSGFAVYPALSAQIVQTMADLPVGPIVSNSLPIWLTLTTFSGGVLPTTIPVYPSFLVPDNIVPPYIVAHVEPSGTMALQAFPHLVWPGAVIADSGDSPLYELGSTQLMRDEVDLTLYGFTNAMGQQYLFMLIQASMWDANFGWANMPALRDAKRTQREITALAQKKTIHVSANYYQATADAIARRLILSASVSNVTLPGVPAGFAHITLAASGTLTG